MQFGIGWLVTFGAIFFMNAFLLAHWLVTDFRRHRTAKAAACAAVNVALAAPFFVYFARFFGGMSYEPYMLPLSYFAGFYLCFSLYAAGTFFFTDIFRGLRRLIIFLRVKKNRSRGSRPAEDVSVSPPADDGTDRSQIGDTGEDGSARRAIGEAIASAEPGSRPAKRPGLPRLLRPRFTMAVAIICACFSLAAFYTPANISVTEYDVTADRGDSKSKGIRAVFISDTHIGAAVREKQIDEIVAMSNELKPDIVLFGGDIIDEGTPEHLRQYMAERFADFESTYGSYYAIGNHDDYRGDTREVIGLFQSAGIHCLLDETALIGDSFYVIGRDDNPRRRKPFAELVPDVTRDLPVITVDHHPRTAETMRSGIVDLQLSGHTHDGQIFPFHIVDPKGLFLLEYGRYNKGDMQIIVSSGAGEYAAPVRLGSPAEILLLNLSFE
jgi:predicted MPP superfamily phosphohydrolase